MGRHLWLLLALALLGCEQAPAEPEPVRRQSPVPARKPLSWTAPPGWTLEAGDERGEQRARYRIPEAGAATHPAELLVLAWKGGTDVKTKLDELEAQFEGGESSRESLKVGALRVQLLEVGGTYRMPMGPAIGKTKKHAAHVLKERWRALAAGVETQGRGTWMFRLLGPEDAVAAARGAFRTMIEGLK